jgi:glutamate--cysteine ligase
VQPQQGYKTPHLTTASTAPLHLLEKQLLAQQNNIENWFESQWKLTQAPIYGSVDLRNAGFKLAPVDMNLFPAGFNNLNLEFLPLAVEAARFAISQVMPDALRILIVPESHTRNLFYWENITILLRILTEAGFEVKVGTLLPEVPKIQLTNGEVVPLETLVRLNNKLSVSHFVPDLILLNNDLSEGIPDILQQLEQPVIPPAQLGWSQRLKSGHFQYYADVSNEFAQLIDIDPWHIAPLFRHCGQIHFMEQEGTECLAKNIEQLFEVIQKKYDEYQIQCKPFVIVKADAGTYGMAVMTIRDVHEIRHLNRKQRSSMAKTKSGQAVNRVIVQEGVYTFETWGTENAVAEPVVYLLGQRVVGGFYRVHQSRGIDENLNAPGMHFEPLAFVKPCHKPAENALPDECQNRFYAYGVIARLSTLAAAREMREIMKTV